MAKKKELIEEAQIATLEEEALEEVESFESEEEEMAHEGTDEIFPFGPSYDQLEDWKSRYDGEIYMSDFDDTIFYGGLSDAKNSATFNALKVRRTNTTWKNPSVALVSYGRKITLCIALRLGKQVSQQLCHN